MERLARFVARLHERGVYFRSLHFANLVVVSGGELGLIDVADVAFSSRPLARQSRLRNFEHLWRYREDVEVLETFGLARFVAAYVAELPVAGWGPSRRRALERALVARLGGLDRRGHSRSRPLKTRAGP